LPVASCRNAPKHLGGLPPEGRNRAGTLWTVPSSRTVDGGWVGDRRGSRIERVRVPNRTDKKRTPRLRGGALCCLGFNRGAVQIHRLGRARSRRVPRRTRGVRPQWQMLGLFT